MKHNSIAFYILMITVLALSGCKELPDLSCEPDVPALTDQIYHMPYYFPPREAFGNLRDGAYVGRIGCGLDYGKVTIVVQDNVVTDCTIDLLTVSSGIYKAGPGRLLVENGPGLFLEAQSPQFDAVSGATGSAHLLKICCTRALWEASEGEDPMQECVPRECK